MTSPYRFPVSEKFLRRWLVAAKRAKCEVAEWLQQAADARAAAVLAADVPAWQEGQFTGERPERRGHSSSTPKESSVGFRVAPERRQRWQAAANREGRPLAHWLRIAGDVGADKSLMRAARARRRRASKRGVR